ncbi:MAG: hypothetical protein OQK12_11835, partial [Motiliproteus sp.]|nr:hypothetical protein [Motiliproteus sp.]
MTEGTLLGYGGMLLFYMLVYCVLHSVLASMACKRLFSRKWPQHQHRYRMFFNILATLLLLPLLLIRQLFDGQPLWHWPLPWNWVMDGMAVLAIGAFFHSLNSYDLSLFSGTKQWRSGVADELLNEQFKIGFWHRYVRHPWYFFALVILWTRQMDLFQLLLYSAITLYFIVGSRLEEVKLETLYGAPYRRYKQRVGGLIP